MEYVDGLDLSKMVKARGELPVANACNYAHQAVLGLQHAHEHAMVHRDIKPGNLMLSRQGTRAVIKVLDFGLAKIKSEKPTDGSLTNEGQMLGTPDYIAPEQIRDARQADIRADIYSLGCTLYYLLTGRPPFQGTSLYDILQAHHSQDAMPLNLARPEVPVELAALVAKMMAKEPDRRFREPKEVAQALKPFFQGGKEPAERVNQRGAVVQASGQDIVRGEVVSVPGRSQTYDLADSPEPVPPVETARKRSIDRRLEWAEQREPSKRPSLETDHGRWRRWIGSGLGGGLLVLSLLVLWGSGVLRTKTPEGILVLDGLPRDADVFIDRSRVKVTWPGSGHPVEISVKPGAREVEVKKDGFRTRGWKVSMQPKGQVTLRVQLIPLPQPPGLRPDIVQPGLKTMETQRDGSQGQRTLTC